MMNDTSLMTKLHTFFENIAEMKNMLDNILSLSHAKRLLHCVENAIIFCQYYI